jgi:hypothetical protein
LPVITNPSLMSPFLLQRRSARYIYDPWRNCPRPSEEAEAERGIQP